MIPANRMGSKTMILEQLKIVQEAVALIAFVPFSVLVMRQPVSWNYAAASVCIFLAVFFIAIPFERRHKMDPFVRYDIEDFE
jgi:uncharacterized protein (DUF486 family)